MKLHLPLTLPLVIVDFFVVGLAEENLASELIKLYRHDILLSLLQSLVHIMLVFAKVYMFVISLSEFLSFLATLIEILVRVRQQLL